MRRLILAVSALALASGCSAASTSSGVKTVPNPPVNTSGTAASSSPAVAPTSAAKKPAKTGDAVTVNGTHAGNQLTITVVKVVDPAAGSGEFSTPATGNRFVAVQFRIHNTGTGTYTDDPDVNVAAIDGAGQQYDAALGMTITAGARMNSAVTVAPGDSVLGYEVFEVPKGQKLVTVQYKLNGGMAGDVAQWTIG